MKTKTGVVRGRRYGSKAPDKKTARHADPFDVWGKPPPSLRGLDKVQKAALRRYVRQIVDKVWALR